MSDERKEARGDRREGLSHRAFGVGRERARVEIPREIVDKRREIREAKGGDE